MLEVRHLDRGTVAATDLCGQFRTKDLQFISLRRADVRREAVAADRTPSLGGEEQKLRELSGGQPGETTPILKATECEAPVAFKPVPAQVGDLDTFTAHGLHRIPEERRYLTDLDCHT